MWASPLRILMVKQRRRWGTQSRRRQGRGKACLLLCFLETAVFTGGAGGRWGRSLRGMGGADTGAGVHLEGGGSPGPKIEESGHKC